MFMKYRKLIWIVLKSRNYIYVKVNSDETKNEKA